MSGTTVTSFGTVTNYGFSPRPVKSLHLITDNGVYYIDISGAGLGTNEDEGKDKGVLIFEANEYISSFSIRAFNEVDYVEFNTSKVDINGNITPARSIGGGTGGRQKDGKTKHFQNVRVTGIGGSSARRVNQLSIEYIPNYQPSKCVVENAGFITYFDPPGKYSEYIEVESKKAESYERITEHMIDQLYSASVEAEYYARVTASTTINAKSSDLKTVKTELENKVKSSKSHDIEVDKDSVRLHLVTGNLMQGPDGEYWMYATSEPIYAIIKTAEYENVLGRFDLTGSLDVQMPGLKGRRKDSKYRGFVCYE